MQDRLYGFAIASVGLRSPYLELGLETVKARPVDAASLHGIGGFQRERLPVICSSKLGVVSPPGENLDGVCRRPILAIWLNKIVIIVTSLLVLSFTTSQEEGINQEGPTSGTVWTE